jgi:hypothetical protein
MKPAKRKQSRRVGKSGELFVKDAKPGDIRPKPGTERLLSIPRPVGARRVTKFPSYSVRRFLREFRQAARDAAKFGKVEVRERGKVIGFLLKPDAKTPP